MRCRAKTSGGSYSLMARSSPWGPRPPPGIQTTPLLRGSSASGATRSLTRKPPSTLTAQVDWLRLHARLRRFLWTLVPGAALTALSVRFNFFLDLVVGLLLAAFVWLLCLFIRGVWEGARGK